MKLGKAIPKFFFGLLFLITIFISNTAFPQKLNNVWIFGEHAGINFNYNPPVGITNTPVSTENPIDGLSQDNPYVGYTSSICDSLGNLLLYTDGISVWNQNCRNICQGGHGSIAVLH